MSAELKFTQQEYDATLALIHIGMLISDNVELEGLPMDLVFVADMIQDVFGVSLDEEPNVIVVRDKIIAGLGIPDEHDQIH